MFRISILSVMMRAIFLVVTATPLAAQHMPCTSTMTIAEIITSRAHQPQPEFTILRAALEAADPPLSGSLSDPEGEFTLFAPTDAAFTAGAESIGMTIDELVARTDLLNAILTYHIVTGRVGTTQLTDAAAGSLNDDLPDWLASGGSDSGGYLNTLNGLPLRFTVLPDEGFFIDGASLILNDFDAANGIIHIIDTMILPPMD